MWEILVRLANLSRLSEEGRESPPVQFLPNQRRTLLTWKVEESPQGTDFFAGYCFANGTDSSFLINPINFPLILLVLVVK